MSLNTQPAREGQANQLFGRAIAGVERSETAVRLKDKTMVKEYSIGELSKQCDVKVPTIRYYEEIALLEPAGRTAGGQRRYPQSARDRLSMIVHARELGFSIDAIREFIRMSNHPDAPCEDLDKITEKHLGDVRSRIKKLQALETELTAMLKSCDHGQVADCRILQVLSDHDQCQTQH